MFKCEECGRITQAKEKQHKKVIKTRKKIYYYLDKYEKERTSVGSEIVKEINVCEKCANINNK